jgi:predicted transcriptional regulator
MVAPAYAAQRSEMAKSIGLGRKKVEAEAPKRRQRRAKPEAGEAG